MSDLHTRRCNVLRSIERSSNRVMEENWVFLFVSEDSNLIRPKKLFGGKWRYLYFRPRAFFRVLCTVVDIRV